MFHMTDIYMESIAALGELEQYAKKNNKKIDKHRAKAIIRKLKKEFDGFTKRDVYTPIDLTDVCKVVHYANVCKLCDTSLNDSSIELCTDTVGKNLVSLEAGVIKGLVHVTADRNISFALKTYMPTYNDIEKDNYGDIKVYWTVTDGVFGAADSIPRSTTFSKELKFVYRYEDTHNTASIEVLCNNALFDILSCIFPVYFEDIYLKLIKRYLE